VCGGVKAAAVGSDGDVWKVTTSGSIYRIQTLDEKTNDHVWKQIPFPKAVSISVSDRQHVAIIDKRGHIFELVDEDAEDHFNAWTHVHLPGSKNNFVECISFSMDGVMWAIDHSHQLWMRSKGVGWTPMSLPCVSVSGASHSRTYVVSEMPEGVLYKHKGYTDFSKTHVSMQ
jgi:hypothetical protein